MMHPSTRIAATDTSAHAALYLFAIPIPRNSAIIVSEMVTDEWSPLQKQILDGIGNE